MSEPDPEPNSTPDPNPKAPSETRPRYGENRPRPQYGEYATPAEVAVATGIPLPDTRGESESVARLSEPLAQTPPTRDARLRHAAPPSGQPVAARHPGQVNSLLTVLLLVFGIWNTVTAIPSFLDLGRSLSQGLEVAGYGSVSFGASVHVVGILLLVFSFLVMIAAVWMSLRRIRMGRVSVWVPLVAGTVWSIGMIIAMFVIVANTPGVTAMLQNHS